MGARRLHDHVVGHVGQIRGGRFLLHEGAVKRHRKHLHPDAPFGHFFQSPIDIGHARVRAHPLDQTLRILTRRRMIVAENAPKSIDVRFGKNMGVHVDAHGWASCPLFNPESAVNERQDTSVLGRDQIALAITC